jgi:hypothetical protein
VEEWTQPLAQASLELGAALAVTLVFKVMLQRFDYLFTPQFVSDRDNAQSPLHQNVHYIFRT